MKSPIAVLGAGSWGTALAILLAKNGHPIHLWEYDKKNYECMMATRTNERYMPGIPFPDHLKVFNQLDQALSHPVENILVAVPSQFFASTLKALAPLFQKNHHHLAWATKGLVPPGKLLSVVSQSILGEVRPTVLTGPTFAREVAEGLPTALVVATSNELDGKRWAHALNNKTFRTELSDDIIGAQMGGAIKNVVAIAIGMCDGLKFGANARCALITRGIAEMMQLGKALGAKPETLIGLAGAGDLILTCTDNQSRNRRFGLALGAGADVQAAQTQIGQVVEGYHNAEQVHYLATHHGLTLPIVEAVYQILFHHHNVSESLWKLF